MLSDNRIFYVIDSKTGFMNEQILRSPQHVAAALSQALLSDTKGQGYHVAIKAVADLAAQVRHDTDGRTALITAAQQRFAGYRKIAGRGGQTFDALALASTEEKILFHGLRQKLPMQQVVPADEARHYTKYGVPAFAQAFQGSQQHLAALSPDAVKAEVATQIERELPAVHQHLGTATHRMGGKYPVLEQLAPLYNAVSIVQSLGQAIEQGVHGGVGAFMQRFGTIGRPAVAYVAEHGRAKAPVLTSFVREALEYQDSIAAQRTYAPEAPGSVVKRVASNATPAV